MLRKARRCGQSSVARGHCASVATWWLLGLVAGLFVVLFCKETRRELFESAETICNFFRVLTLMVLSEVHWPLRRCCGKSANDRKLHRLDVRGACNVDVTRRDCGVVVGIDEVLRSSECPNCCIESVIRIWGYHDVDQLRDSRSVQKHVLLSCMTFHSARFWISDVDNAINLFVTCWPWSIKRFHVVPWKLPGFGRTQQTMKRKEESSGTLWSQADVALFNTMSWDTGVLNSRGTNFDAHATTCAIHFGAPPDRHHKIVLEARIVSSQRWECPLDPARGRLTQSSLEYSMQAWPSWLRPMNVSVSQVFFKFCNGHVKAFAPQRAARPATERPVLAKKVFVWVQDVFRCDLHDTTNRFANSLVAIP